MPTNDGPRLGAVYRVAISASDVGSRVTVRRKVDGGLGDVVGELLSWAEGRLVIRNRHGVEIAVAEDSLVAARRVGP